MNHAETALTLFSQQYNCAQSVAAAYASDVAMDQATLLSLSCGFGGGIGGLRRTCGAVLGGIMILGMKHCHADDPQSKKQVMDLTKQFIQRFQARNDGLDQCNDLTKRPTLQIERDAYKVLAAFDGIRPCAKYVVDCVELLDDMLTLPQS